MNPLDRDLDRRVRWLEVTLLRCVAGPSALALVLGICGPLFTMHDVHTTDDSLTDRILTLPFSLPPGYEVTSLRVGFGGLLVVLLGCLWLILGPIMFRSGSSFTLGFGRVCVWLAAIGLFIAGMVTMHLQSRVDDSELGWGLLPAAAGLIGCFWLLYSEVWREIWCRRMYQRS